MLLRWPQILHLLGRTADLNAYFEAMQVGQSRKDPSVCRLTAAIGPLCPPWGAPPLSEQGFITPESHSYHVAASRISCAPEPNEDGRASLDELAAMGGARWALDSRVFAGHAQPIAIGWQSAVSIGVTLEQHGMFEAALGYARQSFEPAHDKAGCTLPHTHVQAHTCAGRVLVQLGRPDEAVAEFEAAVASASPRCRRFVACCSRPWPFATTCARHAPSLGGTSTRFRPSLTQRWLSSLRQKLSSRSCSCDRSLT
jgi:hypothetical protein